MQNAALLGINTYSALISGLCMVGLGFFVFLKSVGQKLNIIFLLFCFAMANWLLSTYMMYRSQYDFDIIFWDRMVYLGVAFIPVLMYHFGLIFVQRESKEIVKLTIGYFFSIVFIFLSQTDYFVSGLYVYAWGFHTKAQFLHHLFLIFYSAYVFLFLWEIYKFLKKTDSDKNENERTNTNPLKYLFVAFIILNLGAYAFLPAYGLDINPIGAYWAEIAAVAILAFAITKFSLFSIKVILTDLLVGAIGIVLLLLPFLMPTWNLKLLTGVVFILFTIFAYLLVMATREESSQREYAERIIIRERALREDAEQLTNNLQQLDKAKNQFMLSTQHHLRSPLTVIQGYLSMIAEGAYGQINNEVGEKIRASLEEAQKLIKVVDDLLDMAKYRMNESTASRQATDIHSILRDVVYDLKETANKKNLRLEYLNESPLPLVAISTKGIREAIYNIVDNAIKYTSQGGVAIRAQLSGGNVLLSIADTGIGMEEIDKLGLFKRTFERGDRAKEINTTGKGIGLYLAGQMVTSNGGNIWVMSKGRGTGTTFFIELPIAIPAEVANPPVSATKTNIDNKSNGTSDAPIQPKGN